MVSVEFWETHRIYYQTFKELLADVDDSMALIILLSFAVNLYFVCVQLLNSIKCVKHQCNTFCIILQKQIKINNFVIYFSSRPLENIAHAIYFWFSLIFLIVRTIAVSLYSSMIHDESRVPLSIMNKVPIEGWYDEVQRFYNQVANDNVALSGKNFFHLTRKLILTIAGTIVTYELVLIQFNSVNEPANTYNPCK